jgi:hypothetical protein
VYDNKIKGNLRKLEKDCLGPYVIEDIRINGAMQLRTFQGNILNKVFNGATLKRYHPYF